MKLPEASEIMAFGVVVVVAFQLVVVKLKFAISRLLSKTRNKCNRLPAQPPAGTTWRQAIPRLAAIASCQWWFIYRPPGHGKSTLSPPMTAVEQAAAIGVWRPELMPWFKPGPGIGSDER
jgi:hypothetical protein